MIGDYYKDLCKGVMKRVWCRTIDLNDTRWNIHLVLRLAGENCYIEGVYFALIPDYMGRNDYYFGRHGFHRISALEMGYQIVADTSLEAYEKAIYNIFLEFKLTCKDKPAYISALKHIELVSENEVQEIIKQNEQLIEKRKTNLRGK